MVMLHVKQPILPNQLVGCSYASYSLSGSLAVVVVIVVKEEVALQL
jgi:hypothetical protein